MKYEFIKSCKKLYFRVRKSARNASLNHKYPLVSHVFFLRKRTHWHIFPFVIIAATSLHTTFVWHFYIVLFGYRWRKMTHNYRHMCLQRLRASTAAKPANVRQLHVAGRWAVTSYSSVQAWKTSSGGVDSVCHEPRSYLFCVASTRKVQIPEGTTCYQQWCKQIINGP